MKIKFLISFAFLVITAFTVHAQTELTFKVSVAPEHKNSFKPDGRLFLYFSESDRSEPRFGAGTGPGSYVFARNVQKWNGKVALTVSGKDEWVKTAEWNLNSIPAGEYFVQAVWSQSGDRESRINVPGNLHSEPVKVTANNKADVSLVLSNLIPTRELVANDMVKMVTVKSEILTKWWGKPMNLKASVLLPSGYANNPGRKYPVRYNIAGFGGRYTRVNGLVNNENFMPWWSTAEAPQIITVFLDGEGPFGDSYQLDSENSGPYGEALIKELIPAIDNQFRTTGAQSRFLDGCSTGGWVSLALQLFYPESFTGTWSYSPDAVSFKRMQLINIYEDENAFYNKHDYLRPSKRDIYGEPEFSIKKEVYSENVEGYSNSYVTSGGQWGAWNALYSPKDEKGLPKPVFDPLTGKIDKEVADHWKKYDLLEYVKSNWTELGPKVQGKIYVWMGDMDNYYLNNSLRDFDEFLKTTTNPKSDAQIEFTSMKGHCVNYSHKVVLEKIWESLEKK